MSNQPVIFGLIGGGALLLTAAITNSRLADTIQGHANKVGTGSPYSTLIGGVSSGTGAVGSIGAAAASLLSSTPQLGTATAGKIAKTSGTSKFSANQKTFAKRLAADTGLDVNVILAWMQNEQPPGSAAAPNGTNNWLNIGATDSGFYGGDNPAWKSPTTAADETYHWMLGNPIYQYGAPASSIISILATAGQSAKAQIAAIQSSGWASGGESSLQTIYQELTG